MALLSADHHLAVLWCASWEIHKIVLVLADWSALLSLSDPAGNWWWFHLCDWTEWWLVVFPQALLNGDILQHGTTNVNRVLNWCYSDEPHFKPAGDERADSQKCVWCGWGLHAASSGTSEPLQSRWTIRQIREQEKDKCALYEFLAQICMWLLLISKSHTVCNMINKCQLKMQIALCKLINEHIFC